VTRNIPTTKLPTKKNKRLKKINSKKNKPDSETLTGTSREPPGLQLRTPTRVKRDTNRNEVATQEQSYFLVGILHRAVWTPWELHSDQTGKFD